MASTRTHITLIAATLSPWRSPSRPPHSPIPGAPTLPPPPAAPAAPAQPAIPPAVTARRRPRSADPAPMLRVTSHAAQQPPAEGACQVRR